MVTRRSEWLQDKERQACKAADEWWEREGRHLSADELAEELEEWTLLADKLPDVFMPGGEELFAFAASAYMDFTGPDGTDELLRCFNDFSEQDWVYPSYVLHVALMRYFERLMRQHLGLASLEPLGEPIPTAATAASTGAVGTMNGQDC